jgi:hypothetical protein
MVSVWGSNPPPKAPSVNPGGMSIYRSDAPEGRRNRGKVCEGSSGAGKASGSD